MPYKHYGLVAIGPCLVVLIVIVQVQHINNRKYSNSSKINDECSRDLLRDGRSRDRIPVGARFSAPFQTGPGAHLASYNGYRVSFPGVKRPGRGVDHPSPSSSEVKERIELYLYSSSGPSLPVYIYICN